MSFVDYLQLMARQTSFYGPNLLNINKATVEVNHFNGKIYVNNNSTNLPMEFTKSIWLF